MESISDTSKNKTENRNINNTNAKIENIKNNYILSRIYDNLIKMKLLDINKYNKNLQNRLKLSFEDYKKYSETFTPIEIEIIPMKNKTGKFININNNDKLYYHIYFNEDEKEIKDKYSIMEEDRITKIRIRIDHQVKSFENLFKFCNCIESLNFKKFYRNNINNINDIFYECSSLKEISIQNFKTNNITNMNNLFYKCSSLKELNLCNFITDKVINMREMFSGCSSLIKLNISNFNTSKVTDMSGMFCQCLSLKELNITNFNTNNVSNMNSLFSGCSSLKELINVFY